MKTYLTTLVAGICLFATSQAVIVDMYSGTNCDGFIGTRNVWDNTCAYVNPGFQSFKITHYGGGGQQMTAWSRQACAGPATYVNCVSNLNERGARLNQCYQAYNGNGGSNAISSYSNMNAC